MTDYYANAPLATFDRLYEGSVYVAVAAGEFGIQQAHITAERIARRPGDAVPEWTAFTKGVEAREHHTRKFLDSPHEFILHLDGDMVYPSDVLERLRSHRLPCVSGLYYRRTFKPMVPIWFEDDAEFRWPMQMFRDTPEPGRLYRLGATGAGCWLIHRSVYEAVARLLRGENFWLQDDMDVWPYDLKAVLAGRERLRPLRGTKDHVGADVRLGFFVRQAGFTIWGDAAAACGHFVHYPLGLDDWLQHTEEHRALQAEQLTTDIATLRQQQTTALKEVLA